MKSNILIIVLLSVTIFSCKKEKVEPTTNTFESEKTQIKTTYANMASAVYTDAYTSAVALQTAISDFTSAPTQAGLDDCKTAWLAAREIYGQTEIFRFVDGPIDNSNNGPEGLINGWPMDEAYVDYVVGNASAGIINNTAQYPTIDIATIVSANEFGSETNISSGYHAIEFLLWGQDLSANSAGTRPYTDFVVGGTAANQARRCQYLNALADILVLGLEQVKNDWNAANPASYYHTFVNMDSYTALRKMFNAMRVLSGVELAGERIYTAYQNQNQEDEHSCFSDNTHRDIYLNALAIENLYKGNYTSPYGNSISAYALEDLVTTINAEKNTLMQNRFAETLTAISDMYTPFDQAIVLPNERPKVLLSVQSLQQEKLDFESVASIFSISF